MNSVNDGLMQLAINGAESFLEQYFGTEGNVGRELRRYLYRVDAGQAFMIDAFQSRVETLKKAESATREEIERILSVLQPYSDHPIAGEYVSELLQRKQSNPSYKKFEGVTTAEEFRTAFYADP
jgi:hypothetical protein